MKDKEFFLQDRLNDSQIGKFKLFNDEELIFATREHWLPLTLRVIKQTAVGILTATIVASVFILLLHSASLSLSAFFLIMLIASIVSIRDLIHWSFHLYIATNKQIIEIHYSPLLSEAMNSVLLDQIRCTEIDVAMYGFIPELIGIGNVELTFDRPTHKEEFIIRDIRSPRKIENCFQLKYTRVNSKYLYKNNSYSGQKNLQQISTDLLEKHHMDILPINSLHVITIAFRVLFVVAGIMIVVINYLHVKEAKKMEDKFSIVLPGSIQLAISMQLILSIIFLFAIIVFLFVL